MLKYGKSIYVMLLSVALVIGCQPANDEKVESELAALRQEVKDLKAQVESINSDIELAKENAAKAAKPKFRTLPDQKDFDGNGTIPSMGDDNATIAIIEFSDYQCPYCKRFTDNTFAKIKENYVDSGKVKYLTRDFPLGFHPQAKGAAIAANCSFKQGEYWPMRHALFSNMRNLNTAFYQKTASDLKLDIDKFSACLEDPQMAKDVENNIALASTLGIRGTPSFVVGRIEEGQLVGAQLVVGAQDYRVFAALFEDLLKAPK
ncbi:DsbA family protein [Vibrio owensii]|uniref:DsbA family protein n=1 Tax=Vibrio owensii TaxID=696485 RepID=UPI0038CD82E2